MLQYLFSTTKQFTYESGKLLDGGKIYVYIKDTTNLATLYDDDGDYTTNPILLDANGRASVKANDEYEYRLEIYTNRDVLLYTCNAFCDGGTGEGGLSIVRHDGTLTGNGTSQSLLGVLNIPLAVDETMTAYTATVEDKESLVLGVNGDWFTDTFGSALNTKVDWSAFSSCCSAVKGGLDNKLDISAFDLSNYYNKQEINDINTNFVTNSQFNDLTEYISQYKQDKLEFGYDENSAISSINNSALAGTNGEYVPYISGTKHIAEAQLMTDDMYIQVLSSFDLSGFKNHCINVKGGLYRFPNQWEIASSVQNTNWFMEKSAMSAYLPTSSFNSFVENSFNPNIETLYNSAGNLVNSANWLINNKLDISAFRSWSANLDLSGDYLPTSASANFYPKTGNPSGFLTAHQSLTNYYTKNETSSKQEISAAISNAGHTYTGITPIVVNNSTYQISADTWSFSAGSGISFVDDNINKITRIDVTGGCDLTDYYTKTETSSKQELSAALDYISANAGKTYTGVAPIIVNNSTNQISISGEELSAGPNIDIFSSGNYVVISANGFPITGQVDNTTYSAEANFSSFSLLNTYGNVTIGNDSVTYNHAPAVSEEATWLDIIHAANEAPPERPNCYCYKFDDTHTAVNLSSLSAYDKVTIVNAIDNGPDCMLHWDGKTKEIPSGLYVDMIKGTYNNQTEWYFTASGWTNRVWWDYD